MLAICAATGESVPTVVGALVILWAWFSEETEEGSAKLGETADQARASINKLCTINICESLEGSVVKWIRVNSNGLVTLPEFEKFTSSKKKARAATRDRQAAYRKRQKGAVQAPNDVSKTLVTLRNAERTILPSTVVVLDTGKTSTAPRKQRPYLAAEIPKEINTLQFAKAWEDYHAMRRREKYGPWKIQTVEAQLKLLAEAGEVAAIRCLETSTVNTYRGIFPKKPGAQQQASAGTSAIRSARRKLSGN